HVHVEGPRAPAHVTSPAGGPFAGETPLEDIRRGAWVVDDQYGVEEIVLLHTSPRRGGVDRGDSAQDPVRGRGVDDAAQERERVPLVAADRQHRPAAHRSPPAAPATPGRERRATTATSANSAGIGAWGLCTVTSTAWAPWAISMIP